MLGLRNGHAETGGDIWPESGLRRAAAKRYTARMSQEIVKRYTMYGVTVTWKPALCRHTGICARGLPDVFNPRRRPWIELQHAGADAITAQVERCPSGALTWASNDDKE